MAEENTIDPRSFSLDAGPTWWWLSFVDDSKPEGDQFVGVAIVHASTMKEAIAAAWRRGCNPGGEVMGAPVPDKFGPPPLEWDHKLITDKPTIDQLTERWQGCSCMTMGDAEDEGRVFIGDDMTS